MNLKIVQGSIGHKLLNDVIGVSFVSDSVFKSKSSCFLIVLEAFFDRFGKSL